MGKGNPSYPRIDPPYPESGLLSTGPFHSGKTDATELRYQISAWPHRIAGDTGGRTNSSSCASHKDGLGPACFAVHAATCSLRGTHGSQEVVLVIIGQAVDQGLAAGLNTGKLNCTVRLGSGTTPCNQRTTGCSVGFGYCDAAAENSASDLEPGLARAPSTG